MPKKSKESLAEWVLRTTPELRKPVPAAKVAAKEQANGPRWVPLEEWGRLLFGEHAPHMNTLRAWVHSGRIYPMPKKMGRRWFVRPDAEYRG